MPAIVMVHDLGVCLPTQERVFALAGGELAEKHQTASAQVNEKMINGGAAAENKSPRQSGSHGNDLTQNNNLMNTSNLSYPLKRCCNK